MGRRLGLFGGSFNPIHLGHLRAAEEIREHYELDEVHFVLAATPPHKGAADLAPAADRLHMVELAVAAAPAFRTSTMEIERGGTSYSIDTIRQVLAGPGRPSHLVFILGLDAFLDLHTWKDYGEIFACCDMALLPRPGCRSTVSIADFPVATRERFCYDSARDCFCHDSGHTVTLVHIPPLHISATEIRRRVREGRSIRYLVPAPVERYIGERELYRRAPGRS